MHWAIKEIIKEILIAMPFVIAFILIITFADTGNGFKSWGMAAMFWLGFFYSKVP